eukprot:8500748-Karenia_brevis.AAC.1
MIECPRDEESERDEEEDEFPDPDMIRKMETQFREVRRPNKREKKIRWVCGVENQGKKMSINFQ